MDPAAHAPRANLRARMTEHRYDPRAIEPKWQEIWEREQTWQVSNEDVAGHPRSYVLEMLPYPSGEPHMGHLKNYSVGDAVAHFHRRTGRRVLHPMGYDAFGLPAENHAIRTGEHPRDSTAASIAAFQKQFREWGVSIDGRCERCGTPVEARQLEQWFFRITDYADRLLDDLETIDWPGHVVTMQRNWIGRSEGAEVTFTEPDSGVDYPVFTTRPDTLFGATFFVMAPEHPDVLRLAAGTEHEEAVREYVNRALAEGAEERGDTERVK